jgi:putative transposase
MLKTRPHTPAHLFLDDTPYFITGAIKHKRCLLHQIDLKRLLWKAINNSFKEYAWELYDWVILDNHYHILGKSYHGEDLRHIMKGIHGKTAIPIQCATNAKTPIWWNYWDYCPRNEQDYYVRLNYLLWNPVKHGYVNKIEDYPYSSYHSLIKAEGIKYIEELFANYPEYKTNALHEAEDDDF